MLPYVLIQTEWGAKYTGELISKYLDNYTISISHISHSLAKPYELTLEDLTITNKNNTQTYLSTKKIIVGLNKNNPTNVNSLNYLTIENGQLELSASFFTIQSDLLKLKNVSLHYLNLEHEMEITLDNVYGGIKPWSPTLITQRDDGQFNFTAQKAVINGLTIKSAVVQGIQNNKTLKLTDIGGNINQGFFTAQSILLPDNTIKINQFNIQNINFQSSVDLTILDEIFDVLPKTTIELLSITNSSISTPSLTIEKANLEAKNIIYDHRLYINKSDIIFNAQSIIWLDELIESPLIQWHFKDNNIFIEQAIALWNKGKFRLSGSWKDNRLIIDSFLGNNLRYELPNNWYQSLFYYKLPNFIPSCIEVKKFTLMPSLIIDTDPTLPFQFTSFEAFGENIEIISLQDGITINGSISAKADSGTLNTVELKHPDMKLILDSKNYTLDFSTLINSGVIEGHANLLTTQQLQSLKLYGHGVDSNVLQLWHLINNPIKTNRFIIELHGNLIPLSLDGQFKNNGSSYFIHTNKLTENE